MTQKPLELMGAPGSPYTRKMLALMRYRRIAYAVHTQSMQDGSRPKPKVPLLPTYYLPNEAGEIEAVTDSTPLLRRFETMYSGRSVVPQSAVLDFLNLILEDFADEWLTKAMFHYRWSYAADIKKAGDILPRWGRTTGSEGDVQKVSEYIRERQIGRLSYVGSNEITGPIIEASFKRYLILLDKHLTENLFLLGERPSAADFATYGQLTALALFDPTPQALILETAPRIYAWAETLEDLSGYPLDNEDGGWLSSDALPETLIDLLGEIGRVYAPYLLANASALMEGASEMVAEIDGQLWKQNPFPYQGKCLMWLREAHAALSDTDRAALSDALERANLASTFRVPC